MKQFENRTDAQTLALAIVDTLPDPFLVLDEELNVLAASRCFYEIFNDDPATAHGQSIFELTGRRWDVPGLRSLLASVVPENEPIDGFEFEQSFPDVGTRTINLNARPVHDQSQAKGMVLVAIKDITAQRQIEREKAQLLAQTKELLEQQKTLLKEMRHRIANSLQIIASILLLKARGVTSEETKSELRDAHKRVMSVAEVQSHLHDEDGIDQIEIRAYLKKLAGGLASSMIGDDLPIELAVHAEDGTLPSSHAVSLGLIVTELVINAIKYAFPTKRPNARVDVSFEMSDENWKLSVSDNGAGRRKHDTDYHGTGLGTALVSALAKQLDAVTAETSSPQGMTVSVTRGIVISRLPIAA